MIENSQDEAHGDAGDAISIKVPTPTFVEVPVQTIATLNNPVGFDANSDVVMV